MYLRNRHRDTERKLIRIYAQKKIGCFVEAKTNLFKDVERRIRASADDIGEVLGTAIASFRSPFIAEMLRIADLEEGGR